MFALDTETADLIAAKTLRGVLAAAPGGHYVSVEATVNALFASERIAESLRDYFLKNAERFCMLPAPTYIEAMWYFEAAKAARTGSDSPIPLQDVG